MEKADPQIFYSSGGVVPTADSHKTLIRVISARNGLEVQLPRWFKIIFLQDSRFFSTAILITLIIHANRLLTCDEKIKGYLSDNTGGGT